MRGRRGEGGEGEGEINKSHMVYLNIDLIDYVTY